MQAPGPRLRRQALGQRLLESLNGQSGRCRRIDIVVRQSGDGFASQITAASMPNRTLTTRSTEAPTCRNRRTAGWKELSLAEQLGRLQLSRTPSLLLLAEPLALAAAHDVTVLLTGETGTGKTHLARIIHQYSPRRHERLLVVSCGALV